ncbi:MULTISPECIES: ABC transporter substrate-binding protein [unclassified Roseitalea]|uniref:ABC transporter substrate-binding protein n=1 Tax=unclassified Roseitalea TaxID=2639107 RepID=UPI00273FDCC6|nr:MULTISPECIES: ABC transporter substrate-binding protein [unclassified Roseitalea]
MIIRSKIVALAAGASLALTAGAAQADTLRVGVWDLPPGKGNPFTARSVPSIFVWDAIFDPLVRIGDDGAPAPVLAESWEAIEPTRWRFTLKDGITFSNGEPFNADAVVATVEYLLSEEGRASSVGTELRDLASVEKIDERTVEIVTSGPDPVLPNKLALMFIVEPGAWAELGPEGFAESPVGTGAFAVEGWGTGDVTLAANDSSWRETELEQVRILSLPERAARLQALLSGQIDVGFGFSPDQIGQMESAGFSVAASPAPQVMSLAFATEAHPDSPFNDVRVRQAANLAVNRDLIAEVLLGGLGSGAGQAGTPNAFGYDPSISSYPYDPDQARALLEEAGHGDGIAATAHVVVGSFPADSEIYQQAAIDLAAVGIDVELQQISFPEWLQFFLKNEWPGEMFGSSWNTSPYMDTIRPYTYMTCMKSPAHFCDESMTPFIDATFEEFDADARESLLHELHAKTNEVLPAIWLVEQVDVTGIAPGVDGLRYVNRTVFYDYVTMAE